MSEKQFSHIESELDELGIRIRKIKGGYEVYPASASNPTLRGRLTTVEKDLYQAWEAGKSLVAELANAYVKYLQNNLYK